MTTDSDIVQRRTHWELIVLGCMAIGYMGFILCRTVLPVASPEMVNEDPYGNGWMIKIQMSDPAELEALMSAEAYGELIGEGGE